jgi:Cdc6-like AAA superfamily ATPase
LPRDGISTEVFRDRIRDHDGQFVAVLDEIDLLEDMRVLLALTDLPDVAIVTICLDEDQWLAGADERIRSRIRSAETIELSSYGHAELVDILEHRVAYGLDGTVTAPTIADIADRAAGDARVAITLLRQAAKYVDDGQARTLNTQVVDAVADSAEVALAKTREQSFGVHQKALYEIIREAGSLKAGELHREYEERMDDPRESSTRWRYLDRLEAYGLIETTGTGRGTRYHYCGGRG